MAKILFLEISKAQSIFRGKPNQIPQVICGMFEARFNNYLRGLVECGFRTLFEKAISPQKNYTMTMREEPIIMKSQYILLTFSSK